MIETIDTITSWGVLTACMLCIVPFIRQVGRVYEALKAVNRKREQALVVHYLLANNEQVADKIRIYTPGLDTTSTNRALSHLHTSRLVKKRTIEVAGPKSITKSITLFSLTEEGEGLAGTFE